MGMNKNMTGKIPTELGNLTALENLYLGNEWMKEKIYFTYAKQFEQKELN